MTLPESLTLIDEYAFYGCKKWDSVSLPDSLITIGEGAFEQCGMTEITIPKSVKKIGVATFFDCRQLRAITLNGGLVSIGREAFFGCRKLEKIIIKNGVASIFDNMFKECESLLSLSIPSSVSYIGSSSFQGCTGLTEVTILGGKGGLSSNAVAPGEVEIAGQAFKGCSVMERIHIPETVTKIAEDAFEGCRQLTICGRPGSYAETYAKANYIPFEAEGDPIATPTPTATQQSTATPQPTAKPTATPTPTAKPTATPKIKLSKCKITVKDQTYTGKALKPTPAVKYGKVTLKKGTDYTVAYKNNKAIGTATVTLKGKGKYTGTINKTFRILPKGVMLSSLSASKGTITVKWKKGGNITGYQLQYSLKKSFASTNTVTVAKSATTKAVIKKLKSKKTYYVRIRTYKTVKSKKYYSAWSKAKTVKVK